MSDVEHIMVVPTLLFHEVGYFQGFCENVDPYLRTLLDPAHTRYEPRPQMEEDPSFKQLIPYVLFRHTDADGIVRIFQYTRGGGQGEKRLHAKRSVGIGGHISTEDSSAGTTHDVYREGMARDFVRQVQQLRKEADLEIEDRIQVFYHTDDAELKVAVGEWSTYIQAETLADALTVSDQIPADTKPVLYDIMTYLNGIDESYRPVILIRGLILLCWAGNTTDKQK